MAAVNSGQVADAGATVTVRFTQAILQTAQRRGLALPEPLVERIRGRERVSLALQDELWERFCASAADPLIGVDLGLAVQVGHLDTAGMMLMSSETVGEALESLLDYHPIVGEGGGFELRRGPAVCALVYRPYYSVRAAQRVEAVLACLLSMTRWTTGGTFSPDCVRFAHAPLDRPARYAELLGARVVFEADDNALQFPASALSLPLIQANPELCRHLHTLADELLAELGSRSLSAQVRERLRAHPGWGKERVADHLQMSGRHLVRKLNEEGTSFKLLRETLLRDLAEQGLRGNASTAELAEQLGFSDESAFAKAFKRWTGVTPARFRSRLN